MDQVQRLAELIGAMKRCDLGGATNSHNSIKFWELDFQSLYPPEGLVPERHSFPFS
jgi:hypothetical protein